MKDGPAATRTSCSVRGGMPCRRLSTRALRRAALRPPAAPARSPRPFLSSPSGLGRSSAPPSSPSSTAPASGRRPCKPNRTERCAGAMPCSSRRRPARRKHRSKPPSRTAPGRPCSRRAAPARLEDEERRAEGRELTSGDTAYPHARCRRFGSPQARPSSASTHALSGVHHCGDTMSKTANRLPCGLSVAAGKRVFDGRWQDGRMSSFPGAWASHLAPEPPGTSLSGRAVTLFSGMA